MRIWFPTRLACNSLTGLLAGKIMSRYLDIPDKAALPADRCAGFMRALCKARAQLKKQHAPLVEVRSHDGSGVRITL